MSQGRVIEWFGFCGLLSLSDRCIESRRPNWFSLRGAVALSLVILIARVLYLFFVSAYELDGEEAHYWEWSRRLQLSYYTKGPAIAWLIYASRSVFGSTEAAVRLPAAICSCITMIAVARVAYDIAGRSGKAAFYSAVLYTLTPCYFFTSQFMTIDMPYFMCSALAALAAYHALRPAGRHSQTGGRSAAWALLGLALGVGFLFKYTILLMLPGLAVYLIVRRDTLRLFSSAVLRRLAVMLGVFLFAISPVIIWNQREGWPTLAHLLGHLHMPGGDNPNVHTGWSYSPMWTVEGIGTQLGALGLPVALLLGMACCWALRQRVPGSQRRPGYLLLMLLGLPVPLFYLGVSFVTSIEGNWPLAGYIPLLPIVGAALAARVPRHYVRYRRWLALPKPRPWKGLFLPRPQSAWHAALTAALYWGLIGASFILFAPWLSNVPVLSRLDAFSRITGRADDAALLHAHRQQLTDELGQQPAVVTSKYDQSAALAFYLPGRPSTVYCGQHLLGARRTPYDDFPDTDLSDPALLGRPFILVGYTPAAWQTAMRFDSFAAIDAEKNWWLGIGYRGPVPGHADKPPSH